MVKIEHCLKLMSNNLSLITVSENKIPNFPWKKLQTEILSREKFEKRYHYKGGIIRKNGSEIPKTDNIGIVTGFGDVEVVDIDLKVFNTAQEQRKFHNEFISFVRDNILDFDEKFVVYKTKNNGYHILYRNKNCEGNKKLAKLKGHSEAIIETRGIGGYVFMYENNNVTEKTYLDIDYVTDEDREILLQICRSYNYVERTIELVPEKTEKQYNDTNLKVWDDFNNTTSMLDLLKGHFDVVRNLSDSYVVRRHGAKSPHSGYVYKDSDCLYLFSTGTILPHEVLLTPFAVYTYLEYNGDFSASASHLYKQGFGERFKPQKIIKETEVQLPKNDLIFPIDIFPEDLQYYIKLCNNTLNTSIDYMCCSFLFVCSVVIGNSMKVRIKTGWEEGLNIWIALVGKAGLGKTPSINIITNPLDTLNNREIRRYAKNQERYEEYLAKDKKDKELSEEIKQPSKTQFIIDDITFESLVELHQNNKNGIALKKDELAGWFKDMNKYRQGSDLQHWLSSWSGQSINLNRKTSKSSFVERSHIPVLGGIQPKVLDNFNNDENKDSGFLDRLLFCYPDLEPLYYNEREMTDEHLNWYSEYVIRMYNDVKNLINYNKDGEVVPIICHFTEDAKAEWIRVHNEIIDLQKSDIETEYMKSMLPKQISYIPRFSLMINVLHSMFDEDIDINYITKDSLLRAEKLSKYFIAMSKKIKIESSNRINLKENLQQMKGKSNFEKFKELYIADENISKTEVADILGVSRTTIYRYIKELEKNK